MIVFEETKIMISLDEIVRIWKIRDESWRTDIVQKKHVTEQV